MLAIQIIGAGCAACKQMEADVRAVVARLGLDATIECVDDFALQESLGGA